MNIVLPFDYQTILSAQTYSGTADARAENTDKPVIAPPQNPSSARQTQQDTQSQQQTSQQKNVPKDKVSISVQGQAISTSAVGEDELSEEDKKEIQTLKDRDREVRIHEQAHAAVGGQYAGAPTYDYATGPDGKRYAVGGEVSIDVGEESEPEDTIQKMQVVRAAALAPAEPSTQDLKVAAEASQKEQAARAELGQQRLSPDDETTANKEVTGIDTQSTSQGNSQQQKLAQQYASYSVNVPGASTSSFSTSA